MTKEERRALDALAEHLKQFDRIGRPSPPGRAWDGGPYLRASDALIAAARALTAKSKGKRRGK
jgi:hypothetical protein